MNDAFVCWGELLWDLFPDGKRLGGAPSNLAVHLASLRGETAPVRLITRVGRDPLGEEAISELNRRGVDARGVQKDETEQTGRVGIVVKDGEPSYTLHRGAWMNMQFDSTAERLLSECSVFAYGTLSQESPSGLRAWEEAIEHLPVGTMRFCDPNLRGGRIVPDLVLSHLQASNVVKINDAEARSIEEAFSCSHAAQWIREKCKVDCVAQTHGPAGCTLYSAQGEVHCPGRAATSGGDNVGAGDAFGAVLVLGLAQGAALTQIGKAANQLGSFVSSKVGATPKLPVRLREEILTTLQTKN